MRTRNDAFTEFLLSCSGASRELLNRCPESELRRYKMLGLAVCVPALLGIFSGGYAMYLTFGNVTAAVLFGLVWGWVILTIDRILVLTFHSREHAVDNLMNGGFWLRLGLAVIIALTLSKPIELRLFRDSIEQQIAAQQSDQIAAATAPGLAAVDSINNEIAYFRAAYSEKLDRLEAAENQQRAKIGNLQQEFLAEMDGSGGTLRRGIGPIAEQKQQELNKEENALRALQSEEAMEKAGFEQALAMVTTDLENQKKDIQNQIAEKTERMKAETSHDLLAQISALALLGTKHPPVRNAGLLITLLFVFIELIPLLSKAFMKRGAYQFMLDNETERYRGQSEKERGLDAESLMEEKVAEAKSRAHATTSNYDLEILQNQLGHTEQYFDIERRLDALLSSRMAEVHGHYDGADYRKSIDRLKKEFFALAGKKNQGPIEP